ncbi:hypothetical protein [Butyrivibrio sp. AE3004]|uniref:hypothetical protein n=1 Tax=Butyrivibrio sp. AE3004 TaxID=1506994 RepID=UPI00068DE9AB|nr:hypothetical protein [Butyrivibrio sp. AE3004]
MKTTRRIIFVGVIMLTLATACGKEKMPTIDEKNISNNEIAEKDDSKEEISTASAVTPSNDSSMVDLTILSPTMVYGEVFQMMYYPENYVGRKVKMQGLYDIYHDEVTGKDYHACIIQDATACCAQGIEFELADSNYPGTDIMNVTVEGTFTTYDENGITYCTLSNAVLID